MLLNQAFFSTVLGQAWAAEGCPYVEFWGKIWVFCPFFEFFQRFLLNKSCPYLEFLDKNGFEFLRGGQRVLSQLSFRKNVEKKSLVQILPAQVRPNYVPEMIPWCEFLSPPKQSLFWKRFRWCTWSSRSFLPGGRLLWPSDHPSVSSHLEPQTSQGKGRPTLRKNENCSFWMEPVKPKKNDKYPIAQAFF